MWFYGRILRMSLKEPIIHDRVLKKIVTKRTLIIRIKKRQVYFIELRMKKKYISKLKHYKVYLEQERWRKAASYLQDEIE